MKQGEEAEVCSLVEKVFNEFVAPGYGPEGINEFFKFASQDALADRMGPELVIVVAEQGPDIIGVIEMVRDNHISMLFVDRRGQGVAKELIRTAVEECRRRQPGLKRITVNSSPYAESIYGRMGFKTTGPSQKKTALFSDPWFLSWSRLLKETPLHGDHLQTGAYPRHRGSLLHRPL